jgi:hypothetical protein
MAHEMMVEGDSAAAALELPLEVFEMGRPSEFEGAFQAAAKSKASGALMLSAPLFVGYAQILADLALVNRLPRSASFPILPKRWTDSLWAGFA